MQWHLNRSPSWSLIARKHYKWNSRRSLEAKQTRRVCTPPLHLRGSARSDLPLAADAALAVIRPSDWRLTEWAQDEGRSTAQTELWAFHYKHWIHRREERNKTAQTDCREECECIPGRHRYARTKVQGQLHICMYIQWKQKSRNIWWRWTLQN